MDTKCASASKVDELCVKCDRNIELSEVTRSTEFGIYMPYEVKNFKTNIHFKCDGFKDRGKENG